MKPETQDALATAKDHLVEANRILDIGIPSVAGRQAYIAALTAARGLVFELKTQGPKSHKGVRSLMHELVHNGLNIDQSLLAIFDQGFKLKVEADYGDSRKITFAGAREAIDMATKLIERVEEIAADRP